MKARLWSGIRCPFCGKEAKTIETETRYSNDEDGKKDRHIEFKVCTIECETCKKRWRDDWHPIVEAFNRAISVGLAGFLINFATITLIASALAYNFLKEDGDEEYHKQGLIFCGNFYLVSILTSLVVTIFMIWIIYRFEKKKQLEAYVIPAGSIKTSH